MHLILKIFIFSTCLLLHAIILPAQVTEHARPLHYELGLGARSFHIPAMGARWSGAQPLVFAGVGKPLNKKQTLHLGLRTAYSRGNMQGDIADLQMMAEYRPLIARKIEAGIGVGAAYQLSFYPTASLRWTGEEWVAGQPQEGVFKIPLRLSIGYAAIRTASVELRPYLSYQLEALLGYSPSLSPLPLSSFTFGARISPLR